MTKRRIKRLYQIVLPVAVRERIAEFRHPRRTVLRTVIEDYYAALEVVALQMASSDASAKSLGQLHDAFRRYRVRSSRISDEWWIGFVSAACTPDPEGLKLQHQLALEVDSGQFGKLFHWELFHVAGLAVRCGLLVLGFRLRERALSVALSYDPSSRKREGWNMVAKLAALLEIQDFNEFRSQLPALNKSFHEERLRLQHLYGLVCIEDTSNEYKTLAQLPKDNSGFSDDVYGKTVAIVGPAMTDSADGRSIDGHDFVARCKYTEAGIGVDAAVKGLRCDASYLDSDQVTHVCESEQLNWPPEIKWAVCMQLSDENRRNNAVRLATRLNVEDRNGIAQAQSPGVRSLRIRALTTINSALFSGELNAIPNVILDIMRFEPARIKVFHTDLMLTVSRTRGYYPDEWDLNAAEKIKTSTLRGAARAFDFVTQYRLLHRLWKQSLICGDGRFDEVMTLGEGEYIRRMQEIYGNSGRIDVRGVEA